MNETKITISMPKPDEILCPKLDVCFKMLFGSERNKAILIAFLKSILSEPDDDIEDLTLLNPMTEKEYPNDKTGTTITNFGLSIQRTGSGSVRRWKYIYWNYPNYRKKATIPCGTSG